MKYGSLGAMFLAKREENPHLIAYRYKEGGNWKSVTYGEAVDRGERIAGGMASLGIKKGDRVAIVSGNRIEWALIDYATQSLGAVLVTVYPSLLKEQVQYILNDSETKIVFAENDVQMQKINEVRDNLKFTEHFYAIDGSSSLKDPWRTLEQLTDDGREFLEKNPQYVKDASAAVDGDDWATIIYTSGTTGEPKGAILTNNNLLSNVEAGLQCLPVNSDDEFLSFLPLSHVF